MNKHNEPFDQKVNALNDTDRNRIVMMYRGYGKHYTDIVRSMSDKIFNWAFTLNTGGLAVTITFMGAAITWHSSTPKELTPFVIMIVIYALGIISITVASFLEHKRFDEKGFLLDKFFDELIKEKISANEFIERLPPKICFYDWIVSKLEKTSYVFFFVGVIITLCVLIHKATM